MPFVLYDDKSTSDIEFSEINFDELTSCYTYNPLFTALKSQSRHVKDDKNFFQWIPPYEEIHFEKSTNEGYVDIVWLYNVPSYFPSNGNGTIVFPSNIPNPTINVITKMNLKNYRYVVDKIITTLTDDNSSHDVYERDAQTYTELLQNERIKGGTYYWKNILNNKTISNIYPVVRYIDTNGVRMLFPPHSITPLANICNIQPDGVICDTGDGINYGVAQNKDNIVYLMLHDIDKKYNTPELSKQYGINADDDTTYIWHYKTERKTELYPTFSYRKFLESLALLGVYFRIGGIDYLGYMDDSGQTNGEYLTENDWNKSAQYDSDTINNVTQHNPPIKPPVKDDINPVNYGYFTNTTIGNLYALKNKLDLEKITAWLLTQTGKIDVAKNVVSLKEIPFPLSRLNINPPDTPIYIGGEKVTYNGEDVISGQIVGSQYPTLDIVFADFNIPRLSNTFLDYSPYTKYELLLPFAPTPVILPDWCINKNVKAIFLYDIYTTACQYVVTCNDERICCVSGNFGIDKPLIAQNVALKDASRLSSQIATASSVLGGVMSAVAGNIGGIMSGAIGGVSSLSQMILSGKNNYMYTVGSNGDSTTVGLYHASHLKITRTLSAETDGYSHTYGKPLCKIKKLSKMHGFTKCENVNTDGLTCSETEKQMIKQLLENGIYI